MGSQTMGPHVSDHRRRLEDKVTSAQRIGQHRIGDIPHVRIRRSIVELPVGGPWASLWNVFFNSLRITGPPATFVIRCQAPWWTHTGFSSVLVRSRSVGEEARQGRFDGGVVQLLEEDLSR